MLTCFSSKFICSTLVFLVFKRRRLFGSDVWDCCLVDPYYGMLYFIIFSWSVVIGFQELLHSDGGPFRIGSVRMVLLSISLFPVSGLNFVVQVLLCEEFEISDYFIVNRFRFPLESDVRRNSFSDCTGSPSIWFVLTCFPGNDDSRTLSEFSGKLPLHCTLESVLSWYLFVSFSYMKRYFRYFLKNWEFVTFRLSGCPFQLALAVFLSLWNVVLFSSPSY